MSIQYVSRVEHVLVTAINEQKITNVPKITLNIPIANRVQALLDTKVQIGSSLLQNPLYYAVTRAGSNSIIDLLLRAHVPLYNGILYDCILSRVRYNHNQPALCIVESILRAKASPTKHNLNQAVFSRQPQVAKLLMEYKVSP